MPQPKNQSSPRNVVIPVNKFVSRSVFLVWCVLAMVAFAGIALAVSAFIKSEVAAGVALLLGNGFLLAVSVSCGWISRRTLQTDAPLIELTEETFFDRRIGSAPVPWSAIHWRPVYAKNGSIQLSVEPPHDEAMFRGPADRFLAGYNSLAGFPAFTVSPLGTGHSVRKLETLFAQFKPPLPKKGQTLQGAT